MRLLLLLILSLSVRGQGLYETPYQKKMDSLSMVNFKFNIIKLNEKSKVYTYRPYTWVKFTLNSRFNNNVIRNIDFDNKFSNILNDLEIDDYLSLGIYDIRMKLYLSKKVRFVQTVIIVGIQQTYTSGIIIKI